MLPSCIFPCSLIGSKRVALGDLLLACNAHDNNSDNYNNVRYDNVYHGPSAGLQGVPEPARPAAGAGIATRVGLPVYARKITSYRHLDWGMHLADGQNSVLFEDSQHLAALLIP